MKRHQKPVAILIVLLVLFSALGMSSCNTAAAIKASVTSTTMQTENATEAVLQITTAKETPAPSDAEPTTSETTVMSTEGEGVLRVHFLDFGQADAAFIELPDGKTMLIDAGNAADGSGVVSYISNLGYSKIDYLVATHPHEDHIGGMIDVINSLTIGEIYMPKVSTTTQVFENLLSTIQDKGYTINTAQAGVQIAPGINILSPSASSDYGDELNDWSVVISIVYGGKTFLFLGDAGTDPESTFIIDADVVKVAHHGSRTAYSEALYEQWSPEIAIISVGEGNSYGLPDEEVVAGLSSVGATVFRTDINGTIIVESDGSSISVKSKEETVPAKPTDTVITTIATAVITTETALPTPTPMPDAGVVYVTNTGTKFHRDGCRYLDESKITISRADAVAQGYTACKVCDP